jgi:glycerol-3-phosphate dehydrogenase
VSFDLAVIGGGINGAGIARDAAGRGLKVLLVEQGDLAGATSSASTKLIHGGLRYLEHYEFRLVREALSEREVLLQAAPHLVRPMRFVLPHHAGLRPWWMIRTGLFLYDHLGGRKLLPATRTLDLSNDPVLKPGYARGFEYSDCWVDDARLVVLTARDAALRGADIRTRTRCSAARPTEGGWVLTLDGGKQEYARVLVNAAGPWVSQVLTGVVAQNAPSRIRMVKGSHIVTHRLFDGDKAFIFQNADGRVCFAIPYQRDFTLIGTTDEDYTGDPAAVAISAAEEAYLLGAVSAYFRRPVTEEAIVWRFAGVRPLRDDGASKAQETTRDYVLELTGDPPVLSVFGGKITTFRRLAEAALARLAPFFSRLPGPWTAGATLPGGDFPWDGIDALLPGLPPESAHRLVRAYGTDAGAVVGGADLGAGLTEREVDWLVGKEFARTAEDILWRRSKLGLRFSPDQTAALVRYLGD